ncbi:phage gateway protein [Providencia hangzhouensis]|uniref:phage gateway protein n=1 Tax=Providencia hangzhouensis TaxID=3031799 RepID=UPI0034DD8EE0
MTDNDIDSAIYKQLVRQLTEIGLDIPVKAGFQPIKPGSEDNMVMFFSINERGHGWQGRNYNIQGKNANHQENLLSEKTYQVQTVITQLGSYTANDIAAMVRMVINSLPFVTALRKQGIGVQRATDIRQPYIVNEHGDYEQTISFDFNVTFKRSLFPDTAAISALYPNLHRI